MTQKETVSLKIRSKALALGMKQDTKHPLIFTHSDLPTHFDLSATNPDKIILAIWNKAIEHGKNLKVRSIVKELQENKEFFVSD